MFRRLITHSSRFLRPATILPVLLLIVHSESTSQTITVQGRPVPELNSIDNIIIDYMNTFEVSGAVAGIMVDSLVVYLKGFGYSFAPIPENTLTRIASVTKPVTAAAIRKLIDEDAFSLSTNVFDVNQPGGGLLSHTPWPVLLDSRIGNITINHCLRHTAGWDRDNSGDYTYMERTIADDMSLPSSPPGRDNTMRWILGKILDFAPGSETAYSNIGYLALGLIVEQVTGQPLIDYFREQVITPTMWVPFTELQQGRTFRAWQDPREMIYEDDTISENVFDNYGPPEVSRPYGGWDHEARIGQGGIVASAATMLEFARRYHVGDGQDYPDIGQPFDDSNPRDEVQSHGGSLSGTNTFLWQRNDNINVFIAFNKRIDGGLSPLRVLIDIVLNSMTITTRKTADGFWVETSGSLNSGVGGYNSPFGSFSHAINQTTDGSKLRLRPGSSNWTGVITERLLLDAPLGTAVIGIP